MPIAQPLLKYGRLKMQVFCFTVRFFKVSNNLVQTEPGVSGCAVVVDDVLSRQANYRIIQGRAANI